MKGWGWITGVSEDACIHSQKDGSQRRLTQDHRQHHWKAEKKRVKIDVGCGHAYFYQTGQNLLKIYIRRGT